MTQQVGEKSQDSYFDGYGCLNSDGIQSLVSLNACPIRSSTIRRSGDFGGSMSLWRRALRSYMLKLLVWDLVSPSSVYGSRRRSHRFFSSNVSACMPPW